MTRNHEKLLIGVLAGIIIAGAAAFAIQPALAGKTGVGGSSSLAGPSPQVLTLRINA